MTRRRDGTEQRRPPVAPDHPFRRLTVETLQRPSDEEIEASIERDRDRAPSVLSLPPLIEPWRCPTCHGAWTEAGSYALGRCTRCHTPRP